MKFHLTPHQVAKKESINRFTDGNTSIDLPADFGLSGEQLAALEGEIQGKIVFPWSTDYATDKAEFNDLYPANPKIIVYVACIQDIRVCLAFAQENNMETRIRSGRHSFTDYSVCGGLVIDCSGLNSVFVDPANETVWVECGTNFAKLNPALEFYGMHLPGGGCPTVCVAGYMQGGGYGLTSRMFGIQSDCVLEFTMMLADGRLVVANPIQNEDLFWAVRGGTGGNFGVLISIKYRIFPLGQIWGLRISWDFEYDTLNAAQALYAIQENYLSGYQYPNLGIETMILTDIDNDGHKKVFFGAGFIGNEAELDEAIAPLLALPGATMVWKKQGPYSKINDDVLEGLPDVPQDVKFYGRSTFISRPLTIEDYSNILTFFKTSPNQDSMLNLEGYGGAINLYPVELSAYIHRSALMNFTCYLFFDKATNDQEKNRLWMISLFEFMAQYSNGHSYQNYPNKDQTDFRWAYWGPYYQQLVLVKDKYDPNGFFQYQQSIGEPIDAERVDQQIILFDYNPIQHEIF